MGASLREPQGDARTRFTSALHAEQAGVPSRSRASINPDIDYQLLMRPFLPFTMLAAALILVPAFDAESQDSTSSSGIARRSLERVITVSGDSVDHLRIAQLEGRASMGGLFLRSTSSLSRRREILSQDCYATGCTAPVRVGNPFTIVLPQATLALNGGLPFGQNDGAMWAGKGSNLRILAGATLDFGPVRIVAIPEFVSSANSSISIDPLDPRFAPPLPADFSPFASPFNYLPYPADWPYRFGDASFAKLYPGQSSASVLVGSFEGGVGSENEWWGPAIRNPLLFSDNAPGFLHAFLRTAKPVTTAIGVFEGRWLVGGLKESDYFDNDIANDVRSISALSVVWKLRAESGLTLGVGRSVYATSDGYSGVPSHSFDFLLGTGHPNARAATDSTFAPGRDQIFSVFAHWMIPRYGLETYLEWARTEMPSSLRDLLLYPNHTRGYTAGLQYAHTFPDRESRFRFQSEFTNLEQSGSYRFRPVGSFYTSRAAIQGYTNEGQMLGAGLGPGSSGEWFAADYMRSNVEFGLNFGRTRVNNDAQFQVLNASRCTFDVTLYPGARAMFTTSFLRVQANYSRVTRYNAFFQRVAGCEGGETAIGDRSWHYLNLTLSVLGF